ncbi:MAG: hypothetical protein Q4C83_00240 [Candidatus Saccharibacteria bacterium]|nr:hypothetical protein [Candidatus Saccharibacteria bacterium]
MRKQKIKAKWYSVRRVNEGILVRLEFDMSRIETPNRMAKMRLAQVMLQVMLCKSIDDAIPVRWHRVDVTTNGVLAVAVCVESTVDPVLEHPFYSIVAHLLDADDYFEAFELARSRIDDPDEQSEYYVLLTKVGMPYHHSLVTQAGIDQISFADTKLFLLDVFDSCCNVIVHAGQSQLNSVKTQLGEFFDWTENSLDDRPTSKKINDSYALSVNELKSCGFQTGQFNIALSAILSRLYQFDRVQIVRAICAASYLSSAYDMNIDFWFGGGRLYWLLSADKPEDKVNNETGLYRWLAREMALDFAKLPVTKEVYNQTRDKLVQSLSQTERVYDTMMQISADTFNCGLLLPQEIVEGVRLSDAEFVQSFLNRFSNNKDSDSLALLQCCRYKRQQDFGFNFGEPNDTAMLCIATMMHALMAPPDNN